jgi:hypothetical protein
MDADSISEFNQLVAAARTALWPVTITIGNDTAAPKTALAVSGTPPAALRQPDEHRVGYVVTTSRNFSVLRSLIPGTAALRLGADLTVTADTHNPATVGTIWRVKELHDSNGGAEIVVRTERLDS